MLDWFLFEVQVLRLLVSTKQKLLLVNRWHATRFCFHLPTTMMVMMMNVTNPHPIGFLHSLKKYFFLLTYFVGSFISFYHFFLDLWILLSSKLKLVFLFRLLAVFFLAWQFNFEGPLLDRPQETITTWASKTLLILNFKKTVFIINVGNL